MGAQMAQQDTSEDSDELPLQDLEDLVRTLMNNAHTMDMAALQEGIQTLREIRSAYTNKAHALHRVILMLETSQTRRIQNAGS